MSKIYKSDNVTPKSPYIWKYHQVESPKKAKKASQTSSEDEISNENDNTLENDQLSQQQINEIYERARQKAQEKANQIIEQAYEEKEQILENAKQEGYQTGYSEGREQALQEVEDDKEELLSEARHTLRAAKEEYHKNLNKLEPQICDLIVNISHEILSDNLDKNPDLVVDLVREGISKLSKQNRVTIRAHPEDIDELEGVKNNLCNEFTDLKLDLSTDEQLKRGAPILLGESGYIELDVAKQLDELRRTLSQVSNYGS